jgi:site-specific DNA recombinase
MKEKLYIYTRVSTRVQEEGTSLKEQRMVGERISKEENLTPILFNEGGKSSNYETWENRPKIQDIMIGMEKGEIKHLYSWNTDRISRDSVFWNTFRTILIKNKINFYTSNGKYSFDNPTDKLIFNILSSLGEYDNHLRMIRTHRGKISKIKMGYWMGGPTPFGYDNIDKKLVENKKESKWVKYIYESFNKGKSIREIRQHLFVNGIKTRRGNDKWSLGSIESVLNNSHYGGHYKIHDKSSGETIKCISPQILPTDTILTTRELLDRRSHETKMKTGGQKQYYLLKGLLWCKTCGSPYSGRVNNYTEKTYYCRKEGIHTNSKRRKNDNRYLNYERTNKLIWDTTIDTLKNSTTWKELEKERILGDKSERIKKKRKNTLKIKNVNNEIKELENTITMLPTLKIEGKTIKQTLKKCEIEILKLTSLKESLEQENDDFSKKDKWIDWINKYQWRLLEEGTKKPEEQREFLNGIITRIDVKMKNKTEHEFDIHYKLPIVNDKLDKKKVIEGQNTLTLTERTI